MKTDFNLRPGGGLLGLRDRQRENEQQQSQSAIVTQSHPHIPRTILSNKSILDKDRSDFRERAVLGDDRYDRRPFNRDRDRDRDYDRNKDRNSRMNDNDGLSGSRYNNNNNNNNSGRGDRMNSYSQYNYNDNRRRYDNRAIEEPEWFSEGPTSQNDTIELRGFDDAPNTAKTSKPSQSQRQSASNGRSSKNSENGGVAGETDVDKAFDNFEHIEDNKYIAKNKTVNEKSNDTNNNGDNDGVKNELSTENESTSDENADGKLNKNDDNFNFEDFLKMENISDMLSVRKIWDKTQKFLFKYLI